MSQSQLHKWRRARGFTILEVIIALGILMVGVVSVASLSSMMMMRGHQSKFLSLASMLASDKLEDLNRWDQDDPQVCVPAGNGTAGSLTADVMQTTTCGGGASASIAYYDDVSISLSNSTADCPNSTAGCFAETISTQVNGANSYVTTYHSPDGIVTTTSSSTAPANQTFHRRWVIEGDQPLSGVRRVTVQISANDKSLGLQTLQMSLVRP